MARPRWHQGLNRLSTKVSDVQEFPSGKCDPRSQFSQSVYCIHAEGPSEKAALITFSNRVGQAEHDVPYVASLLEKVLYLTQ